jgi:ABC-2 type transport system permease protein
MAPIIHINPNGVPLEAGSPLYDAGVVLPGLILTLLFLLASSFLSTRWFSKGGRYHETI